MAYRVTSKFIKDDTTPWPWDREDLPWLTQAVDLLSSAKSIGETPMSQEQALEWLKSVSSPTELHIVKEFDTQELANRYVLALYDIVTDYSADFESWGNECGYVNIRHALSIEEV
jgi:hypothetical protein